MTRKIVTIIVLFLSVIVQAQEKIFIYFDSSQAKIGGIYIQEPVGIFKLNAQAKLQAIILGKFTAKQVVATINDYERDRIKKVFQIGDIQVATNRLKEINYPDKYTLQEEAYKDLPVSINNYKFSYFDNYYDDDVIKGKVKSVGGVKIKYYKNYYLNDVIKGSVSRIGTISLELLNNYYQPETIALVSQIGTIKIAYSESYSEEKLNGKVIAIGGYKITYFNDVYDQKHLGEFKNISGSDSRFVLLQ